MGYEVKSILAHWGYLRIWVQRQPGLWSPRLAIDTAGPKRSVDIPTQPRVSLGQ